MCRRDLDRLVKSGKETDASLVKKGKLLPVSKAFSTDIRKYLEAEKCKRRLRGPDDF